jgi:AraC-like DNA-binding protein
MDSSAAEPNLLLRGGAVLLLGLIAALLWRDRRRHAAARLGAAFALGVAAATLSAAPGFAAWPLALRAPLSALASGSMFVFWLFTRALLDDAFAARAWHAAVWLLLAALGVAGCIGLAAPGGAALVGLVLAASPVAWALLAVAQSLASWREDLVEGRRRLRALIVAATAAFTIGQWLVAWLGGIDLRSVVGSTANAAGTAALCFAFAWLLLQWRGNALFDDAVAPPAAAGTRPAAAAAPAALRGAAPAADADPRQVATLESLMTAQRLYREPNLTIAALALRMGLPEHRLRRLINQALGHRHFSAFLNGYRIDEAKRALRDPALADVPVLAIAMDVGFTTIGPFNRAFKAQTGLTPTEFRRGAAPGTTPVRDAALAESGNG